MGRAKNLLIQGAITVVAVVVGLWAYRWYEKKEAEDAKVGDLVSYTKKTA